MEARIHTGHCLCGKVRYTVRGDPVIVAHCHCDDCQRLTGSGHSTGAMYPVGSISLDGKVTEYELISESGNRVTRVFCSGCGSPILGRNSGIEGFATLSLGTMDDSTDLVPGVAVFTRNRKPWDSMDESIQSFDAQPVWSPRD
ncbi:MAG: GFA family protein [Pseudomonadales bacterium]